MPRFWVSGPRLFGGLVRPGISFALSELRKKPSRATRGGEPAMEPVPGIEPVHEIKIKVPGAYQSLGPGHSPAHFAAFFRALFWFLLSLTGVAPYSAEKTTPLIDKGHRSAG